MTQDDLLTLAQRLREYNRNPHHINPVSNAFHRLITDSADALSQLAVHDQGEVQRLREALESMMRDTGLVSLMRPDQVERNTAALAASTRQEA